VPWLRALFRFDPVGLPELALAAAAAGVALVLAEACKLALRPGPGRVASEGPQAG
jgi:hypothetical protein